MVFPRSFAVALVFATVGGAGSAQTPSAEKPIGILLAAGDIATCESDLKPNDKKKFLKERTGQATAALVQAEIDKATKDDPKFPIAVLALGDLAYNSGEKKSFDCFNKTWGKFKNRILPVPGNHDYETDKGAPYREYFADELNALKADKTLSTYAVDFPASSPSAWRLLAVNSNAETGAEQPQVTRLEQELKEHQDRRCVLAFAHAFYYSSGDHGHADKKDDANAPLVPLKETKAIYELLHKYRATTFVAGHDHHFEQLGRTNADAKAVDLGATAQVADGVRSFVVGTGGKALYPKKYVKTWAFTEAYDHASYGILKIELFPTSYRWQFIPTKNNAKSLKVIKGVKQDNCNR